MNFLNAPLLCDSNNPSKLEFLNLLSQDCIVFQCDPTIIDTDVTSGEMTLSRDGNKIENIDEINKELASFLQPTLTKFVANALLI